MYPATAPALIGVSLLRFHTITLCTGHLDASELLVAFRKMGMEVTLPELQEMVLDADASGEGHISYDEA